MLAGFVRIVTHPRIFIPPSPLSEALRFVEAPRATPATLEPPLDPTHVDAFVWAGEGGNTKGVLVSDAYLAGIVMSLDAELVTADRGFACFPGLRWRDPL